MRNQIGNTGKKPTTSKNAKTGKKLENIFGRGEERNTIRTKDKTRREKSESTGEGKKTKKIPRQGQNIHRKQDISKQ